VHPQLLPDICLFLKLFCFVERPGVCDADGHYAIDSLYFDTPDYRFFRDGEEQQMRRLKLRIRTYPDTPGSVVKVEVKHRTEDLIEKTSMVLPQQNWATWLKPGAVVTTLDSSDRQALESFIGLQHRYSASPRMLVRYRRQAWHSAVDDYVRVTFDRQMVFQPMRQLQLEGDSRCWRSIDTDTLLMEVKFRMRPPVWAVDLIRRFGLSRQGFSKYGTAVRRTMCGNPLWDLAPALRIARSEGNLQWMS
jgi:hypothetical protein